MGVHDGVVREGKLKPGWVTERWNDDRATVC